VLTWPCKDLQSENKWMNEWMMTCCAYSCTQYSLHTQYMLLTQADDLLCRQLHTVLSPYTVHATNPCWCLALPTAAHSSLNIFWTCKVFTQFTNVNTVNEPELDTNSFSEIRYNDIKVAKLPNYMSSSQFWFWKRFCRDIFWERTVLIVFIRAA
jgi:hypothetical protein